MSRIGYAPIDINDKVEITITKGNLTTVKGPNGELVRQLHPEMIIKQDDGVLTVERPTEQSRHKALHGLTRSLLFNMVQGVTEGYEKILELVGIGFRANNTGNLLELQLGYSHPVMFMVPEEVKLETESKKGKEPKIILKSANKELIGQVAAKIRDFRPPEPYKGKGIRYQGEWIRRKAGKTVAAG